MARKKEDSARKAAEKDARKEESRPVLEELRRLIKASPYSQRQVESRAGFSSGYLSQLLCQNVEIKVWQILKVLAVLGERPQDFFDRLYPPTGGSALDRFTEASAPLPLELDDALARLYETGAASLQELHRRLERCERAVAQLEANGLVDPPPDREED